MRSIRPGEQALLVFDETQRENDRRHSREVSNYLYKTTAGQAWEEIIPSSFFVDSETVPGIQAADLAAYVINQWHAGRRDEIADLYEQIREMTRNDLKITVEDHEIPLYGIRLLKP